MPGTVEEKGCLKCCFLHVLLSFLETKFFCSVLHHVWEEEETEGELNVLRKRHRE